MTAQDDSLINENMERKRPLPFRRGVILLVGLGILLTNGGR